MNKPATGPAEMRAHDRVTVSESIRVTDRQSGAVVGHLVNISHDGIMVNSTELLEEGAVFQLTLESAGDNPEVISLGAECLWCHRASDGKSYWSGFYIIDIADDEQAKIDALTDSS